MPWISFCIATYKRPDILTEQLTCISRQTFRDFEVIISDNDPDQSAKPVVAEFDNRFRYFHNSTNIGMIGSFNKSIERSSGKYLLMTADDDLVEDTGRLEKFYHLHQQHPGLNIYINCQRKGRDAGAIEIVDADNFAYQLLNPTITKHILWSDAILESNTVKRLGGLPNYTGIHLSDHALLALCGRESGGMFINHVAAPMNVHGQNFSKNHIQPYYDACKGFYELMRKEFKPEQLIKEQDVLLEHVKHWAFSCLFTLRGFLWKTNNKEALRELDKVEKQIFDLAFMQRYENEYRSQYKLFVLKNLKKYLAYLFVK